MKNAFIAVIGISIWKSKAGLLDRNDIDLLSKVSHENLSEE